MPVGCRNVAATFEEHFMSDTTSLIAELTSLAAAQPEPLAGCLSRVSELLASHDKLIKNLQYRVDQLETRMAYVDPHRGC